MEDKLDNMAHQIKTHDERFERITLSMEQLIRNEERLDNYHKRINDLEDSVVSVQKVADDIRRIKQKLGA